MRMLRREPAAEEAAALVPPAAAPSAVRGSARGPRGGVARGAPPPPLGRRAPRLRRQVALSALEGAACMNNTFCLAIFMALVFFQGLAWKFAAETISILLVQIVVVFVAVLRTQRLWHGVLLLCLFPLSIVLVAGLEGAGLD